MNYEDNMSSYKDGQIAVLESKVQAISLLEMKVAKLEAQLSRHRFTPIKTPVLDNGYVELHDKMGDDLRIVNMARQSFGQESEDMGKSERGLINFLAREQHGTPFEGPVFTFNVKCPIFVAREWMRHRIGSYNEYSGRYTQMMSDFYIPSGDQLRTQTGKPGAYHFEPMQDYDQEATRTDIEYSVDMAWRMYETMLNRGVAKEVARMVLPVNIYTQFTWVVNLRALLNFVSLRSAGAVMWEIRQYSQAIEKQVETVVPVAMECFENNGRKVP
jgi:thymidylate synthase (FAD)